VDAEAESSKPRIGAGPSCAGSTRGVRTDPSLRRGLLRLGVPGYGSSCHQLQLWEVGVFTCTRRNPEHRLLKAEVGGTQEGVRGRPFLQRSYLSGLVHVHSRQEAAMAPGAQLSSQCCDALKHRTPNRLVFLKEAARLHLDADRAVHSCKESVPCVTGFAQSLVNLRRDALQETRSTILIRFDNRCDPQDIIFSIVSEQNVRSGPVNGVLRNWILDAELLKDARSLISFGCFEDALILLPVGLKSLRTEQPNVLVFERHKLPILHRCPLRDSRSLTPRPPARRRLGGRRGWRRRWSWRRRRACGCFPCRTAGCRRRRSRWPSSAS